MPVIGDVNYEADETLSVTLSSPTNAVIDAVNATATGTILNDDSQPTVSVASASVLEPNVGTTNLTLSVSLSTSSFETISVDWTTTDGSALAGSDYVATNGTLTFDPGVTNLTVSVAIKGDTLYESNEVFYVTLSPPANAAIGPPGVVTIISDDGLPGVLDHFTFSTIPTPQYATLPIALTITAMDASNSVITGFNGSVALTGNASNTPGYTFDFEEGDFSQWTPLNLGNSPGPYQIVPFDVPGHGHPSLAFRIAANSGAADGITRPVTLQGGTIYSLSVDLAASNDYGVNGDASTAHVLINGQELGSFNFNVYGEISAQQIFRTNLTISFIAPSNGVYDLSLRFDRGYGESGVWSYADNVRITSPQLTPTWISPFTNGVWSGNLVAATAGSNIVLHVDDGDGHFGDSAPFTVLDYADVALQTAIAPNPARVGASLVYTLLATNLGPGMATDLVVTNLLPPNQTFLSATSSVGTCFFSNGVVTCALGPVPANQAATVTIVTQPFLPGTVTNFAGFTSANFDPNPANNISTTTFLVNPPLIFVSSPTVVERTGTTTNAQFQVWIGTPFIQTIDVDYATAAPGQGFTAATAGADYLATSGHLTFTPALTNQTITVTVLDDLINEPTEAFAVVLSNPTNAQIATAGICSILDNFDPVPLLAISDASLLEGNSGTNNMLFNVTLSRPSGYTVQVRYATSSGTAISGSDFVTNSGTLSFPPGTTNLTISVGVRGDTVKEPDETFFVTLSNPANALIQRAQAIGTILNDDTAAGQLDHFSWSAVPSPQYANLTFPVTLTARDASNSVFTGAIPNPVNLTVMRGTTNFATVTPATAGSFVSGVWSGTISISTAISNVVLRADDGQQRVGTSNPFDVLAQTALVLTLPAGANENAGVLTGQGKISLPRATGGTVTVNLSSSDTTEVTVPASVTVAAGQSNATFDITVVNDAILDGTQTATITASASGYLSATAPFSVFDDETATLTVGAPASVSETAGSASSSVTISAAPASAMAVTLTSSDPTRIQVPASLGFAAGQTFKTFNLTIINDRILQGTTSVTITAHVQNWTDGVTNVMVVDDETNNLAFQFTGAGATYPEGTLIVTNASVGLVGSVATNVTVALTSSDTNSVIVPASVVIPAGSNFVPLNLTVVDDALTNGTHIATLTATAAGFSPATTNVSIMDNEWHHFDFNAIPSPEQGSVAFSVTLTACDVNDVLMTAYSGYITLTATDGLGNPVPLSPTNVTVLNGQWTGNVTVPTWEYQGVRITATDTDGHTSQSDAFDVIPPTVYLITLSASDLAYSETSKLIYASTTNNGTLTPVNPSSGTLGTPISITNLSGRLCASDGGQYVFAALNGATNHICQFDVNSQTVVNAWALDGIYVEDMAPVLGSPAAVAVSRWIPNRSPRFGGVVIYDNGVARTNVNGGFTGSNVIEPSRSPSRLYGYDNEVTSFEFQLMKVDASGITVEKNLGLMSGFGVDFVCRGGWIFATTGQIFDPERGIQVGSFGNTPVADDAASGRYYLASAGALVAYDQNTLLPVGATALPGVTGAAGSFIRWGTNGFALRVSSTKIALIRTPLISTAPSADLRLSVNLPPLPVAASNVLTYTLTVSNQGTNTVRNVVLTQTLPANSSLLSAVPSSGSNLLTSGGLVSSLLAIPAGGNATVTVNLQTLKPGLLAAVASVTSDSLDPNLTNNVVKLEVPVATIPAPDTVTELALPTTDIAWDKFSGRIFASAPNADWLLGNSIIALDPLSGNFDPRIPMAVEPAKLAVADNGQYLYAGINSDNSIQRVNLAARAADLKFPTGLNYVADMAVLPGSPQAVAVTAHTTFAVYDNGVMRPNTVGPGAYNFEYYLTATDTNTLAYEAMPDGLRSIAIDSNGATLLNGPGLIKPFDDQIYFDAGRLYTAGGEVIDPLAAVVVTNLPYSGLVCPDSPGGKVFYLTVSGSVGTLHAVNVSNFVEAGNVTIPNITGTASSLIRWGVDGLAFRTTGGQLFLIRTTLADDRNNDGLPDTWQLQYFGYLGAPGAGPLDDPDHDGMNNLREYQTGSNPLVYDSLRFLTWQMQTNGTYLMTVLGTPGQRYALLASTNLSNWVPILTFTCTNFPTVVMDPAASNYAGRFYLIGPLTTVPQPRLGFGSGQPLSSNGLDLTLEGFAGVSYQIEGSTNLLDWVTVTNFIGTNSITPFRDASATNQPWKFSIGRSCREYLLNRQRQLLISRHIWRIEPNWAGHDPAKNIPPKKLREGRRCTSGENTRRRSARTISLARRTVDAAEVSGVDPQTPR